MLPSQMDMHRAGDIAQSADCLSGMKPVVSYSVEYKWGMLVHGCDPSTVEGDGRRIRSSRLPLATYALVGGQSGIYTRLCLQKKSKSNKTVSQMEAYMGGTGFVVGFVFAFLV